MLNHIDGARRSCQLYLVEQESAFDQQMKRVQEELESFKKARRELENQQELLTDADSLALQAERQNKINILLQSYAIRPKSVEIFDLLHLSKPRNPEDLEYVM